MSRQPRLKVFFSSKMLIEMAFQHIFHFFHILFQFDVEPATLKPEIADAMLISIHRTRIPPFQNPSSWEIEEYYHKNEHNCIIHFGGDWLNYAYAATIIVIISGGLFFYRIYRMDGIIVTKKMLHMNNFYVQHCIGEYSISTLFRWLYQLTKQIASQRKDNNIIIKLDLSRNLSWNFSIWTSSSFAK